ncbi:MAG: adenosylcobinamide-GDP ribazoletransferase [Candidatus Tectimicrobiota bacterium]|nr:MAG: adenosylcobinamide-GDP ribazoletransferase [Candidatus Tectomicrobia bacterium]
MAGGLRRALGFLTVCPLRASDAWTPEAMGSSMVYYPLVGLGIGLALWLLWLMLSALFPPLLTSALLLGALVLITGGLHLDGLADTLDGLSGGYSREEVLRILKDPHVGTMAVAGVCLVLLTKFACLAVLSAEARLPALVLMATLSRYSMVQLAYFSPYARPGGGLGEPFVRGIRQAHFLLALALAVAIALLGDGGRGGLVAGGVVGATWGYQRYFRRRLQGITGDVLGAVNELNEALVLILMVMMDGG